MNFKEILRKTLHAVEMPYDWTKHRLKRKFNLYDPVHIFPYRGFGNEHRVQLLGRVIEEREVGNAQENDSWWRNGMAVVRRFTTDEIPHARVRGQFQRVTREVTTDSEGYFHLEFDLDERPSPDELWHDVSLELLDEITHADRTTAVGRVLVPPGDAEFGVVSDIDDTILKSSATDLWRMAWLTFSNNAHTRTPFPHVARFYQALQQGSRGAGPNPVFYVSSSAWNIYDLLAQFIELHQIPAGPILLRDLGLDSEKFIKSGHDHKLEKIEQILGYYPDLPFVLIGDSGQRDPWLYREAVRRNPGRIAAIYIRDIRDSRRSAVQEIVAELKKQGVEMLLIEDARSAARHAHSNGMITQEWLERIEQRADPVDELADQQEQPVDA